MEPILIKSCNSVKFYDFYPNVFNIERSNNKGRYQGMLFYIRNKRYVLRSDGFTLLLQSKHFTININDYFFTYNESKAFSYLFIVNGEKHLLKKRKSIWELLNLSTYDEMEKIEDNNLYYLYDIITRFKNLSSDKERKEFLQAF